MTKQKKQLYLVSPSGSLTHCEVERTINGVTITLGERTITLNQDSALDLADMIILEISEDFNNEA